jgi:hypothetical protein
MHLLFAFHLTFDPESVLLYYFFLYFYLVAIDFLFYFSDLVFDFLYLAVLADQIYLALLAPVHPADLVAVDLVCFYLFCSSSFSYF